MGGFAVFLGAGSSLGRVLGLRENVLRRLKASVCRATLVNQAVNTLEHTGTDFGDLLDGVAV